MYLLFKQYFIKLTLTYYLSAPYINVYILTICTCTNTPYVFFSVDFCLIACLFRMHNLPKDHVYNYLALILTIFLCMKSYIYFLVPDL